MNSKTTNTNEKERENERGKHKYKELLIDLGNGYILNWDWKLCF